MKQTHIIREIKTTAQCVLLPNKSAHHVITGATTVCFLFQLRKIFVAFDALSMWIVQTACIYHIKEKTWHNYLIDLL
jgi:hypothetical protein